MSEDPRPRFRIRKGFIDAWRPYPEHRWYTEWWDAVNSRWCYCAREASWEEACAEAAIRYGWWKHRQPKAKYNEEGLNG